MWTRSKYWSEKAWEFEREEALSEIYESFPVALKLMEDALDCLDFDSADKAFEQCKDLLSATSKWRTGAPLVDVKVAAWVDRRAHWLNTQLRRQQKLQDACRVAQYRESGSL